MRLHDFIFSNKTKHRITRHLVFWAVYCTFFWLNGFAPSKYSEFYQSDTFYFAFLNMCAFGPVFVLLVYFFIYYLLPYLRQQRYALFLFYFLIAYLVGTLINYYTAGIFLNTVHYSIPVEPNFQHRMEYGNYNTREGMIIAIIALGIKLSKDWYLQQQENLDILKRKTRTEMQSQKSRIHPDMLFRSLDTIYSNIQAGSKNSNSLILNLSDLLSYSLYESDMEKVSLDKELLEMQHLISIENLSDACTVDLQVESEVDTSTKLIVPMTVVKLVEECVSLRKSPNSSWQVAVKISVSDSLNITFTFYGLTGFLPGDDGLAFIDNIHKRMNKHYFPGDYQTEFTEDSKNTTIKLALKLENMSKPAIDAGIKKNTDTYDPA